MENVEPMEIGLVFWAEESAGATLQQLRSFGLQSGQLGVPPTLDCGKVLDDWKSELAISGVNVTGAVCSYAGEDYSTLARVHESVGFTTSLYRAERIARTREIAAFAHALGIYAVSCHIGFIPADPQEVLYAELVELTRVLCDACAEHKQNFVLETGQEAATVLLSFIADVSRTNLKVNFDPANMILYGSGDPTEALALLQEHVLSVHCKDGQSPVPGSGLLGSECALGDGEVDFPAFLGQLKRMGYTGSLAIEREEPNLQQKLKDIQTAIGRLKEWKADAGLYVSS
ncbi:sugar phosphate isomerase/epimerase family protein [Edaphobacter modestus]|uniref:Xylose isomerase-like TIM barrel protein n=1 Tax=Edaphobacter modestus TaxID=388466 RepID=A0A4V2G412_9BACT|nr:sugar phosphate isomerase/epimerase family protein [Edaphobacter modestus]RZU39096.1 xylose isomerase-like TIM barrel protein [Edaphobacter modestus]